MKLGFVLTNGITTTAPAYDATAWHSALPRPIRKTLRLQNVRSKAQRNAQTHDGVDDYFHTGYRDDAYRTDSYHNQNLVDYDPCTDEFQDIDDEYKDLTVVSIDPKDEAKLFHFCTGYDIL